MKTDDLNTLDRTTLWLWRASNLAGWGLAGAIAAAVTFVISARALVMVPPRGYVSLATAALLAGGVAGVIVGDHVYRSPRLVAAVAVLLLSLVLVFGAAVSANGQIAWVELTIVMAGPLVACGIAALVAGVRFRHRPRALHADR